MEATLLIVRGRGAAFTRVWRLAVKRESTEFESGGADRSCGGRSKPAPWAITFNPEDNNMAGPEISKDDILQASDGIL